MSTTFNNMSQHTGDSLPLLGDEKQVITRIPLGKAQYQEVISLYLTS